MFRHVLLLKPNADAPLLDWVSTYVHAIYANVDVMFTTRPLVRKTGQLTEWVWKELDDGDAVVRYVEDEALPASWLAVTTAAEKKTNAIVRQFRLVMATYTLDELRQAASAPAEHRGALSRLALALNHTMDEASVELLVRGLTHADVDVRLDAAMAATLLRWRELAPALTEALGREPSEPARRVLQHALEQCVSRGAEGA